MFVHLGAVPVGPPVFEALYKLRGAHIIFDLDDALFMGVSSSANPLAKLFRSGKFIERTVRLADKVVVTNPYLERWARRFNDDVRQIPTTIDPEVHHPPPQKLPNPRPVLGWTGTFTTAAYLEVIRPFLRELQNTHDFTLRVICNTDPGFPELKHYEFVPWRKETEIEDLWPIDIGLMPLDASTFVKGKLGFKAIQYSALEIPSVVSDEGSGREVVEDGVTGFTVANTCEAWCTALRTLLDDPGLRAKMGEAARAKVLARYAVPAQAHAYRALFV